VTTSVENARTFTVRVANTSQPVKYSGKILLVPQEYRSKRQERGFCPTLLIYEKGTDMIRQSLVFLGLAIFLALPSMALAEAANVLFILDGSGSMQAKMEGRPKIEVARTVMGTLVKSLPTDVRVGLETYGRNRKDDCNDIETLVPIGSDRTAFLKAVNELDPKGSTPLTGAIKHAATQFREVEGSSSVVVVSDGKETCGGDPCTAVREALAQGVKIQVHVVGFDVTPEEAEQLQCMAKAGNGKYFAASNAAELGKALAQVKEQVVAPTPAPPSPPPPATKPKPVLLEEQFERDNLGEDYNVLEPDPNRFTVSEGKLLIVATRPQKNIVLAQQTFPGDFVATTTMNMQVTIGNRGGLYYWVDEQNYLFLGIHGSCCNDRRRPIFEKLVSGQGNIIEPDQFKVETIGNRNIKGFASQTEVWYLQLERTGVKYIGRISVDGKEWMDIGTHTVLQKNGRLGFGTDSGGENENPAEFDNFVVQGAQQ
jgi:hypothetical protein